MDDCSNDNSPKIIKSINFQGVSHKIFFQKKNKGLPTSLNKIIKELEKSEYSILSEETGLIEGKNKDKKWMLITYYCPTHGDSGRVEPLQITRQEISKNFLEKNEYKRNLRIKDFK